ncbi:hypothetical protein [Gloeobacter kilaueensis]|uniref:Uncharacterized protein n=1 Tax=Gloeobacter kilaueensis (strain ATCC BAA-2537 / CCAP 1431/1 / ULC 316 / JS1) TaxID=1183438 RepID=U5QFA0_GLOK1|nr:hypothetical protein [Gloeobacter kilaueensis]AGY57647.1 hypothetical protein GKIL_1401 [Gloeobacter kilaueensis JS1]
MNKPLLPEMPDEATHRRLTAQLQAVAAEMRAWSQELQELEERFERDYQQSPIGQFHARLRAQRAEQPKTIRPERVECIWRRLVRLDLQAALEDLTSRR